MERCDICDSPLHPGVADWHFVCRHCLTEYSSFKPAINSQSVKVRPDEQVRAAGLAPLRQEAYTRLLKELASIRERKGGSLLEVGSAHAWFLTAARAQFDRVVGIEPDDAVRLVPNDAAIEVRSGYFPVKLAAGELFDVIAFNDVFEHIPHARRTAAAVAGALGSGGIAVITLPVREGALYRAATFLFSIGLRGPFERMWQKDFPSPHLYYFSERGLMRLFTDAGLRCEQIVAMPSFRMRGLWARIRYAESRLFPAALTYACSALIAPFTSALSADVKCFFFRRPSGT